MKNVRSFLVLVLIVFMCFTLIGCNALGIDVESQLRPPKNNGNQEELQNALDAYITANSEKGDVSSYTLKYPSEGQYLSAFILLDQVKPHTYISATEAAAAEMKNEALGDYCIAFYRMDVNNANTHVHLLKKEETAWRSVADVEGYGEEIAQVEFADFDGDGFPELLVGWNMYNTKDKRLIIYSTESELEILSSDKTYTGLAVGDLTADGSDDFLLMNISTGKRVNAHLYSYLNDRFTLMGKADMDSDIQRFGESLLTIFPEGERGVFIDAYKDPGTTITELILWKGGMLDTPLCDKPSFITTVSAREVPLACRDIDRDGNVEWPVVSLLPGQESLSAQTEVMKTAWYAYDSSTDTVIHDFDSVINTADGYSVRLNEQWPADFSVKYHKTSRILEFIDVSEDVLAPFLKFQTTTSGKKADLADDMVYFDETDSLHYAVWRANSLDVTMEEIRYLFSVL